MLIHYNLIKTEYNEIISNLEKEIGLAKSKVKPPWTLSNMASLIINQLTNYIDIRFLEYPEGCEEMLLYKIRNDTRIPLIQTKGLLFEQAKKALNINELTNK